MASTTIAEEYRSLSRQPPTDPDIQATLSDFLTYTEHFPSHVTRALALIEQQAGKAERKIAHIHRDTTSYALLPTLAADSRPDPVELRKNISYALEEAERACRMRVEEAVRLEDMAKREADRLDTVVRKLKEQPMPPSRDPTPAAEEQRALTSPNLKRESRLGVRSDEIKVAEKPHKRFLTDKAASKLRGRKIMVPGEVLPPPDPNAPVESISDWTSPRVSPPVEEPPSRALKPTTPQPRARTPKPQKQEKDKDKEKEKEKVEKSPRTPKSRGPRQPGQPGTNAHSALAGISTSNALLALKPPPDDAVKGSKWMPWMRLTEWEMAKLRKRMKKNAIWVPSLTMVRRELKNLGRGAGYRDAAKADAEAGGEPFVDEPGDTDPTKVEVSGDEAATITAMLGNAIYTDQDEDADAELINRGMRLNEAKKLKRARMLEEQKEAAAQLAREQGTEMPDFDIKTPGDGKKRKRESTPAGGAALEAPLDSPDQLSKAAPPPKKLKIALPPTQTSTSTGSKVPLAPAGVSASPKASSSAARRAATPPVSKRPSLILKASKAVSEEPPNRRTSLRRGSNGSVPLPDEEQSSNTKAPSRRSKRPAPGVITNGDAESAKVGVSKRKSAPKKKASSAKPQTPTTASMPPALQEEEPELEPDPLEPRYCLCGDVSWGTMIACDNEDNCEKEWFHLSCVGLEDLPPRRTKWYCPDCRRKLKLGVATNGLVGRMVNATGAGAAR